MEVPLGGFDRLLKKKEPADVSLGGVKSFLRKDAKQEWLKEQERRMRELLKLVQPELEKKDFFRTIEKYYEALNVYLTFAEYEAPGQKQKLEGEIFSVYRSIFHGLAEETELANVGDRYGDAMQLYELSRVLYEDSGRYLPDAKRKEIYQFVDKIYSSLLTLVKLHEKDKK